MLRYKLCKIWKALIGANVHVHHNSSTLSLFVWSFLSKGYESTTQHCLLSDKNRIIYSSLPHLVRECRLLVPCSASYENFLRNKQITLVYTTCFELHDVYTETGCQVSPKPTVRQASTKQICRPVTLCTKTLQEAKALKKGHNKWDQSALLKNIQLNREARILIWSHRWFWIRKPIVSLNLLAYIYLKYVISRYYYSFPSA